MRACVCVCVTFALHGEESNNIGFGTVIEHFSLNNIRAVLEGII